MDRLDLWPSGPDSTSTSSRSRGALWAIGEADRPPVPPLILAGDFGGGGAFLALGMVSAMWEASRSGQGQVVDAAIVDGALNLMAYTYGNLEGGTWNPERQSNPHRWRRLAVLRLHLLRRPVRIARRHPPEVPRQLLGQGRCTTTCRTRRPCGCRQLAYLSPMDGSGDRGTDSQRVG